MVDWTSGTADASVAERDTAFIPLRVPGSPDVFKEFPVSGFVTKDASGNVGINIGAPVSKINAQTNATVGNAVVLTLNNPYGYGTGIGTAATGIRFARSPTDGGSTGIQAEIFAGNENETTSTSGYLAFGVRNGAPEATTEAMRIVSGGNLAIGRTSTLNACRLTVIGSNNGMVVGAANSSVGIYATNTSGTAAWQPMSFCNNGASLSQIGSITCSATTTSYNTTSDYRLKNNIRDLSGSGAFIDALRPREWDWALDGTIGAGFVAHEFAEVSPTSVTGEKDAMQDREVIDPVTGEATIESVPAYQSMQASSPEVMAHIIAELQSLRARVAQLEAAAT